MILKYNILFDLQKKKNKKNWTCINKTLSFVLNNRFHRKVFFVLQIIQLYLSIKTFDKLPTCNSNRDIEFDNGSSVSSSACDRQSDPHRALDLDIHANSHDRVVIKNKCCWLNLCCLFPFHDCLHFRLCYLAQWFIVFTIVDHQCVCN